MIYPTNTGKSGEHLRLTTLESVWIQGKLRMWGRWSYIGGGKTGNMFNQLLASKKRKRAARTVLTGMCYSVGSATRQGSSSPTRFIGQSAMTSRT